MQLLQRLCAPSPVLRLRLADKLLLLLPTASALNELTELLLWVLTVNEAVGYSVAHGLVEILAARLLAHANALLLEEALPPLPSMPPTLGSLEQHNKPSQTHDNPTIDRDQLAHACKVLAAVVLRVTEHPLGRRRLAIHLQPLISVLAVLRLLEAAASKDSAEAASTLQRALHDHMASNSNPRDLKSIYTSEAAALLRAAWRADAPRLAQQLLLETCWVLGAAEAPQCQLLLCKAPTQEEFIRGSMGSGAYRSSDIGETMRDVKNFICSKLDMAGLIEDDFGMELLVQGRIVGLGLRIADVYAHLGHTEGASMVVTYRLKGLDGDATEPFLETIDSTKDEDTPEERSTVSGLDEETLLALTARLLMWRPDEREALSRLLVAGVQGREAAIARVYFGKVVDLAVDNPVVVPLLHMLASHVPSDTSCWPSAGQLLCVAPQLATSPSALARVVAAMPAECKGALMGLLQSTPPNALLPFVPLAPALDAASVVASGIVSTLAAVIVQQQQQQPNDDKHAAVAVDPVCQLLTALCSTAADDIVSHEGLLDALHAMETQQHEAAKLLLERLAACCPAASSTITAMREHTINVQRARAQQRRAAALASLAAPASFLAEELEDEELCACLVCREGYLQAPGSLLGVYALLRGDTLTSNMHPIHLACHAAAKRADASLRVAKTEWEGAALRNGNVPCNCIVPLFDASVDEDEYKHAVQALGCRSLWALGRAMSGDTDSQLLPWVLCAALVCQGEEGGEEGEEAWQQALQVAQDVRAGRSTCEDVFHHG